MYKTCPFSCGVCSEGPVCEDKNRTQCHIWADADECLHNPIAVVKDCPESCGVCTTGCMDHDENCKGWAFQEKLCHDQAAFMYRVCPASCGICSELEGKDEL